VIRKEEIEHRLTPEIRHQIFSDLGIHLDGRTPSSDGWINGLRRPPELGVDNYPDFSVNLNTGAVKDFGSDYSNDLIGLAQDVRGITFPEALEWCAIQIGLPLAQRAKPDRGLSLIAMPDMKGWSDRLVNPPDMASKALHRYLTAERGLKKEIIDDALLGIRRLYDDYWLIIPIEYDQHHVTNYKLMAFSPDAGNWCRDEKQKKRVLIYGKVVLYIHGAKYSRDTPIIFCEGELDALLAYQHGFTSVTGTGGAGTFKPEWISSLATLCEE